VDFYTRLAQIGLPDGGSLALVSLQKTKALAEYGQATANITDSLYLTLGGRFQKEKRRVVESSINLADADGTNVTNLLTFGHPSKKDTNFSPKVVLGYRYLDDSMVYLSWSKGFKSGTFNTVNVYNQPEYVKPETVTSYELGSKNTLADGQVTLNAAAFHTDIKNQQVQFVSLLAGGAVRLENAAKVKIDGGELELAYHPDWDPNLYTAGSLTYLKSKYEKYDNASAYDDNTIDPTTGDPTYVYNFGTGDFSGNRTVRTPKWAANAVINRSFPVSTGAFEVGLTGFYSSSLFFQAQNNPISKQKAYETLDAQASYLHEPWNLRITLLAKNITDEQYQLTQFHTDAGVQNVLAPPRAFGVRLDWTFK
jgi:iron complex outermembrane receptor protein